LIVAAIPAFNEEATIAVVVIGSGRHVDKGVEGSTQNPFTHALSVLGTIVTLVGERHPMTFLGLPGLVLLCVGLYGWIWVINRYAEVQTLPTGTALVSTILLLIGIFAVFAGLILFTISGLVKRYR